MTDKPRKNRPEETESALNKQLAELTQALQRERADAVNLRRRHEADLAQLRTRVKANVVQELLPVIDNFERALSHVPKDLEGNAYVKGVQAVVKQFEQTLQQMGITRIRTVGEHFDPNLHEAIGVEEGEGQHEVITEEMQAGYRLGDDVIRHAMVKVKNQ